MNVNFDKRNMRFVPSLIDRNYKAVYSTGHGGQTNGHS